MQSSNLASNWDGPPPATLLISGYLLKRSDTIRRWNKRWCSLDPTLGRIEYRVNQNDRQPKGYMNFDGTTTVIVSPMNLHGGPEYEGCCIYFTVPRARKEYFLAAETPELATEWVNKIWAVVSIMGKHEVAVAALKGQPPPQRPFPPQRPVHPQVLGRVLSGHANAAPQPPPYSTVTSQKADPQRGPHASGSHGQSSEPPPSSASAQPSHQVARKTSPPSSVSSGEVSNDLTEEARQALITAALMGARSASSSSSSSASSSSSSLAAAAGAATAAAAAGATRDAVDRHGDARSSSTSVDGRSPLAGAEDAANLTSPSSTGSATPVQGALDAAGNPLPSQEALLALLSRRDQELKDAQAVAAAARNAAHDAAAVADRCARACREMEERLSLQEKRQAAVGGSAGAVASGGAGGGATGVGGGGDVAAVAAAHAQREAAVSDSRQTRALLADAERKLASAEKRAADAERKVAELERKSAEAERRVVEMERKAGDADRKARGIEEAAAVALRGNRMDVARLEAEVEALRRDRDRAVVALDQENRRAESAHKEACAARQRLEQAEKLIAELRQSLATAPTAPYPPPLPSSHYPGQPHPPSSSHSGSAQHWPGPGFEGVEFRSSGSRSMADNGSMADALRRATESVLGPCGVAEEDLVRLTQAIAAVLIDDAATTTAAAAAAAAPAGSTAAPGATCIGGNAAIGAAATGGTVQAATAPFSAPIAAPVSAPPTAPVSAPFVTPVGTPVAAIGDSSAYFTPSASMSYSASTPATRPTVDAGPALISPSAPAFNSGLDSTPGVDPARGFDPTPGFESASGFGSAPAFDTGSAPAYLYNAGETAGTREQAAGATSAEATPEDFADMLPSPPSFPSMVSAGDGTNAATSVGVPPAFSTDQPPMPSVDPFPLNQSPAMAGSAGQGIFDSTAWGAPTSGSVVSLEMGTGGHVLGGQVGEKPTPLVGWADVGDPSQPPFGEAVPAPGWQDGASRSQSNMTGPGTGLFPSDEQESLL